MSQSLAQLWTHLIFSTKERKSFFENSDLRERLYYYILGVGTNLGCHDMTIGGVADHVHMLIDLPKKIALSSFVERIKTSSSKWIKTTYPADLKLQQFAWQRGYGAFSVSYSSKSRVQDYIRSQEIRHAQFDFENELRQLLKKHNISFDERYLFDA